MQANIFNDFPGFRDFDGTFLTAPRCASFRISFVSSRTLHCLLRVVGSVWVCRMLRHVSYVASCVWRLCHVAHWVSSTMLRAHCWVSAAPCSPHTKCGSAVCFRLHLACARVPLHVVCCPLHVVCWMRCLLHAVFCAVSALCRMVPVVCCLVACCPLHAVCCLFQVAVCCQLHR